jgi:hypothetical protein
MLYYWSDKSYRLTTKPPLTARQNPINESADVKGLKAGNKAFRAAIWQYELSPRARRDYAGTKWPVDHILSSRPQPPHHHPGVIDPMGRF